LDILPSHPRLEQLPVTLSLPFDIRTSSEALTGPYVLHFRQYPECSTFSHLPGSFQPTSDSRKMYFSQLFQNQLTERLLPITPIDLILITTLIGHCAHRILSEI